MLRTIHFLILVCLVAVTAFLPAEIHISVVRAEEAPSIEWIHQFGGDIPADDFANAVDADGNTYIAGATEHFLGEQSSADGFGAFVRKYDANGYVVWTSQFGSDASDYAAGVSVDSTGIYVAGYTEGTLSGQSSAGGVDAFVRKYDANGYVVCWTSQFGSSTHDFAVAVSADSTGIYVAGYTYGALPGQESQGSTGWMDAFVRKYDANGNVVWTRQFGSSFNDVLHDVSADSTGIYVAGCTDGALPGQSSAGGSDAFIRKYDANGNVVWTRQFGSSYDDPLMGISIDSTGIYVAGRTDGALPGQSSAGGSDAFVRKYDTSGNEVWTRQFGSDASEHANGVSVDSTGIYVAGYTFGALPGQSSAGGSDAFIRKYDASGNEVWTRQFGSASNDDARGISVDSMGIYVAGGTYGAFPGQSSAGGCDAFVRRYDASGNEVWTRQFGSDATDYAEGVSVDSTGAYVAGWTSGALPGQSYAGFYDAFISRYDASGNEVWTRQFGSDASDHAHGVSVDSTDIYVAGDTYGIFPGQSSAGLSDAFVRRYDANGNEVWTRQFGTASIDGLEGISADSTGIYVAGYTYGTFPGQSSAGSMDAFIRKYDASGDMVWTRQFGSDAREHANGVSVDSTGIYVAGYTFGALPGQSSAGGSDAFIRKYDASGNEVWTRQFGSASNDDARGISVDSTGIYVAGWTEGAFPGQSTAGGGDAFVRKYDASGTEVWTRQFGTASSDGANSISVDSTGIYVAAYTSGTLPGQSSAGGSDAFVRKYDISGNVVWTRQFGTPSGDGARGISVDPTGIYVVGGTFGAFPGQSSADGYDAFVAKFTSASLPDLVIDPDSIQVSPSNPVEGQPVSITGTVRNLGGADALSVNVAIRQHVKFSDPVSFDNYGNSLLFPVTEVNGGNVTAHGSADFKLTWDAVKIMNIDKEGLVLEVDPLKSIGESSETNNTISMDTKVTIAPSQSPFDPSAHGYSFENWAFSDGELADLRNYMSNSLNSLLFPQDSLRFLEALLYPIVADRGHCFGMASTSILYYENQLSIPAGKQNAFQLLEDEASPNIAAYHTTQIRLNIPYAIQYAMVNLFGGQGAGLADLYNSAANGSPIILNYNKHAVTVTGAYSVSDNLKNIVIYDNNYPGMGGVIQLDLQTNTAYYRWGGYNPINVVSFGPPYEYSQDMIEKALHDFLDAMVKYLWDRGLTMLVFGSPVHVTITDEDGLMITDKDGGSSQIPGASVLVYESTGTKMFFLPKDLTYAVKVEAYDSGECTVARAYPESENTALFDSDTFELVSDTVVNFQLTPESNGSTPFTGITREVNGNILPGVAITLDGIGSVVSDQDGHYEIMANATGPHTLVAHKDGFRDRPQTVNVAGLGPGFAVTCNFQGQHGLIPKAPDIWYALDCVNLWLYPPNPDTGLDIWTALDVINAWLYPLQ